MDLLHSFAVIVLTLFMIHYIMVNVLNIPFKDLVRVPGILGNHGMSNIAPTQPTLKLSDMERELKASFGVTEAVEAQSQPQSHAQSHSQSHEQTQTQETNTNRLPDPFRVQAAYDPEKDRNYPISAANDEIYEKEAQFGNEQTNVSQFFALNPGVFFNDQRHNAYVPDVSTWNSGGQQMFSQMVNAPRQLLQAYGYDKPTHSVNLNE